MRWLTIPLLVVLSSCGDDPPAPPAPPWPEWALHHWVWEDESTQASATELVDGYLARDIPVGAVIIDSPWATGYNTFEWDVSRFPDPQAMIDHFHAAGVKVLLWIVPAINTDVPGLYDEAAAAGYFMQQNESSGPAVVDWWKGEGSLIDYWNPEAVSWWHDLLDRVLDMGIDGWKTDGLDYSAWLAPYSPARGEAIRLRNEYSDEYYRDSFDYARARRGDHALIMSRPVDNYGVRGWGNRDAAFTPVDITWAGWVGDQDATFTGMTNALDNLYWSGDLGYVNIGSDIGGYRNEDEPAATGRTKELFLRWTQLGALCPLMENGGGGVHRPWLFDEETTAIYRTFVELHHALVPYMMREGGIAFAAGEPLMRFVDDVAYQYQLGPDLFVAPLLAEGGQITLTLPSDGDWTHLFGDGATHRGGKTLDLTVPLAEYPVFVRAGSALAAALQP